MPFLSKARISEYLKPFLKPFERYDAQDMAFRSSMEGVMLSSLDALNERVNSISPEEIIDDQTPSDITTFSSSKITDLLDNIPSSGGVTIVDGPLGAGTPATNYDDGTPIGAGTPSTIY